MELLVYGIFKLAIIPDTPFLLEQNSTLQHYTLYEPVDLCHCVKDLYRLCCGSHNSTLPAIREKYSQHKVSKIHILCLFLSHSISLPEEWSDVHAS